MTTQHAVSDEERVRHERELWKDRSIYDAQAFKHRLSAAFRNPHCRRREERREQILRERCRGAVVLDYGCFGGAESRKYLDYGAARVVGIDISEEAIRSAQETIRDPRAEFRAGDAHELPFPDATFDVVVGRAILHHLNLERAYREIARVLKPGGLATFVEPLRGNPGAKLARLLTPKARTPDELPLDHRDIATGDRIMGPGEHEFSGAVSTPAGLLVSVLHGSEDGPVMRLAASADELVEHTPLKYWGRLVYLYWHKPT